MREFSRSEVIQGARWMLPEEYANASDHQVEAAFRNQLAAVENTNAANIMQGIAGAVGSLGNLIGGMVGGSTGRTIGNVASVAGGLGNLGANLYRQFSAPSPVRTPTPGAPVPAPMPPRAPLPAPRAPFPAPRAPFPAPRAPFPAPRAPLLGGVIPPGHPLMARGWPAMPPALMGNRTISRAFSTAMQRVGAGATPRGQNFREDYFEVEAFLDDESDSPEEEFNW